MTKTSLSLRWPLLAIVIGLASPISAATAASVKAQPAPVQATPKSAQRDVPAGTFDVNSVPITKAPLPPFPYIDWPSGLPTGSGQANVEEFDRRYVIAGQKALPVEGRIELREFSNTNAKLSTIGSQRNYENALKAIGATRVDAVIPFDIPDVEASRGEVRSMNQKFHLTPGGSYSAYLIRTPNKNVWFALSVNSSYTKIMTIDEKPMTQSVGVVGQSRSATR